MTVPYSWKWSKLKKKKNKKPSSKEIYLNSIKKEYPNREGKLCINYNRKDDHTYVFYWEQNDYFTEFHNRNLLHPIPKINTEYYVCGLRLRQAYYRSIRNPKLTMHYGEKQNITGYDPNTIPIGNGFNYYMFLVSQIPVNSWNIVKKIVVEEKPTEENNWRNRQSLMSLLSDGLGALFDHFHNRNKDKYAPDYVN